MDIERGCLEILFKEIPYNKIDTTYLEQRHDYSTVNESLFLEYSQRVFKHYSEDERRNNYLLLQQQMKDNEVQLPNIFKFVMNFSRRLLTYKGGEIKCKFDEMLRWREISFQLGQDIFTCAFLAGIDLEESRTTDYFAWLPIIRSDDERLHNILNEGMAENHFHLNGSTKIFELSWVSLMNEIIGRRHDFKKIKSAMQLRYVNQISGNSIEEDFYRTCQRAALYRIYLFLVLKKDDFSREDLGKIDKILNNGVLIDEKISEIQDKIDWAREEYGAKVNQIHVLDYAFGKNMVDINDNDCRLLAGERWFLYECYKAAAGNEFNDRQKNIFYTYLAMRTYFRSELIQVNRQMGFANFSNYQDRKEYFIEGKKLYEKELVSLALNASLEKQNIRSLEARICPKEKSYILGKKIETYNRSVKIGNGKKSGLTYVLHFLKSPMEPFCDAEPRNYITRNQTYRHTKAIAALLEKGSPVNHCIRGIDACSSEIGCRPEVFGQYFRYLTNLVFKSGSGGTKIRGEKDLCANLHTTYHAGEDFLDIVDGLRAIDEVVLFCGIKRGSRIGHALALGIDAHEYYKCKGYKLVLPKQDLLDNIVWILRRVNETGCKMERRLQSELEERFQSLWQEIYGGCLLGIKEISVLEYYQSWKLRGDCPKNYRQLDEGEFLHKLDVTEISKIARHEFNGKVPNEIRKIAKYRELYYLYHYDREVHNIGSRKDGDSEV